MIHVRNESSIELRDLELSGTGFNVSLSEVAAGAQADVSVYPRGESGLRVKFLADGRAVVVPEQGYFEGGGGYEVGLVIHPDLSVAVDAHLRAY